MIAIIALTVATSIPLVFLYAVYTLDLYRTGSFRFILLCFAWGGMAYGLSALVAGAMLAAGWITRDQLIRISAPIVEEIIKGALLLYLIRRPNFTYFVDGAIYGFSTGIGFAIIENYEYVLGRPEIALSLAVQRVLSTNLIHATASALIGIALGVSRFDHSSRRLLFLFGGLTLAMGLHLGFNNMVSSGSFLLAFAILAGFSGAAFIVAVIRRGLHEEKQWIEETLGMADRVTVREAAVVQRLKDVDDILAPLADRFGDDKARQIEQFLLIQARLGILRKTVEKLQDEKMRSAVKAQMADLREKMEAARRSVGWHCMLYLRNIFPEDASPLWGRLQAILDERAATGKGEPGTGLWTTLEGRVKQTPPPAASES